jgi:M6 family metalloprotease-like protein
MRRSVLLPLRLFPAALFSVWLPVVCVPTGVAALASGQSSNTAETLAAQPRGSALETRGRWEGTIEEVISDDFAGARSWIRWYLNNGQERIEMFFIGETPRRTGIHVGVEGTRLRNRLAVTAFWEEPLTAAASGTALTCTTTGPQNIAVLMLTMPSNPTFPSAYTQASLEEAFFGSSSDTSDTQSLNGYWKEMSYGQTSATGQVFGPFALSQNYDDDTQNNLLTAAIAAADSTVNFAQFTRIALVFPIASWGTAGEPAAADDTVGCATISSPSKGSLPASIGWLPAFPNSSPPVAIYAHEFGHALGLNHTSSDDYGAIPLGPFGEAGTLSEYGDPFSLMGGSGVGQYVAEHKSLILHWLNPGDYREITSSGSLTLEPLESTADPRGLRVLRDSLSSAWLWLEYRQPIGAVDIALQSAYGNLPFNGALVHYEDPYLDSPEHTYLLDSNPVSLPNNFTQSALAPGSSWSDPYSPLTIDVGTPANGGLPVSVTYIQPCASLQYSATTFPASGGSGTIAVSAPGSCSWSASTPSNWISFPGATSGSGNGTVPFSVAANSNSNQQNGYITVERQSTRIIEEGTRWSVLSVNPSSGTGATGQFTFAFNDVNGYQDIAGLSVNFSGSPTCQIYVYPSYNELYLLVDQAGAGNPPPIVIGTPGTASNSVCSISTSGSSITGSGNQLSVTLAVDFLSSFGGSHRMEAFTFDNVGDSSPTVPLGTWIVPSSQADAVLRDTSGSIRLSTYASPALSNSGGLFASDPSAAQNPSGNTLVAARDNYSSIWANVYNQSASTWSGWQFGGGIVQGVPAIAVATSGTGWIASRDTYNSYWLVSYTSGGGFGSWIPLEGIFSADPVVTACGDGSIYLIGKDNWNSLWSGHYIPGTGFQGWVFGGGIVTGKPAATCGSDNAVYVVAEDSWNSNWMVRVSGNTWGTWYFGGAIASVTPRIAALGNGSEAVVILDPTNVVWRTAYTEGTGNGWQPWVQVGGILSDVAPAGVGGELYFAGKSPAGDLWWWQQSGNQWTWIGNNGVAAGALAAAPR